MTRVTIGDDQAWTFDAAVIDDERWNGWACPWFTESEGRKIADVTQLEYRLNPEYTQEFILVHENAKPSERFSLEAPDEDQSYFVDSMNLDGVWIYAIGAANWTWEVADDTD